MSAFNGSGTFVISGSGLPYVTGTTISSTVGNQLNTDLATGLSTCITKDGQSVPTANIPMGGFKITGLGSGVDPTDAVAFSQVSPATGTFTPTDGSGASLVFTNPLGYYRKYAGFVHIWGSLVYPATASGAGATIASLPFTSANLSTNAAGFQGVVQYTGVSGLPGGSGPNWLIVSKNATTMLFRYAGGILITNAMVSTVTIDFFATYPI